MAHVTAYGFLPGASPIHRLDPRLKLGAMAVVSVVSLHAGWPGLVVFSVFLLAAAVTMSFPLAAFFSKSRYVLVLLALIVFSHGLFTPGAGVFSWRGISLSQNGIIAGSLVSWRLLGIILVAALVMASTPVECLAAAVCWFLKPVPVVNAERVGMQLALVIRFIPLILHQAVVSRDAQSARCVGGLRHPVRRLRLMVIPLMRRIFLTADCMALAMAARCYSEPRTQPPMAVGRGDAVAAVAVAIVSISLILL